MTSFEREAVEQAQQVQVAGGVLARNSDIDLAPVRRWLAILAEASEEPSIVSDFEALLQRIDRDNRIRDALAGGNPDA